MRGYSQRFEGVSFFSYLLLWGCLAQSEMKKQKAKDQARLAWQQEVEQIDHQISELQAIISHSKENIMQLRSQRQDIIERHRKRRRRPWDDKTPMSRLVNLHEREAFNNLMNKWQQLTEENLIPSKTMNITFVLKFKWYVLRALAQVIDQNPTVFKVSTLQLCEYMAQHTNLGTADSIRKGLQRAKKTL